MQEELIRLSRANPRTVLFITHSVEEAVYLADRVVVMAARSGQHSGKSSISDQPGVSDDWAQLPVDEVMDLESFVHLRTKIWKLLRHEMETIAEIPPKRETIQFKQRADLCQLRSPYRASTWT